MDPLELGQKENVMDTFVLKARRWNAASVNEMEPTARTKRSYITPDESSCDLMTSTLVETNTFPPELTLPMVKPTKTTETTVPAASVPFEVVTIMYVEENAAAEPNTPPLRNTTGIMPVLKNPDG